MANYKRWQFLPILSLPLGHSELFPWDIGKLEYQVWNVEKHSGGDKLLLKGVSMAIESNQSDMKKNNTDIL